MYLTHSLVTILTVTQVYILYQYYKLDDRCLDANVTPEMYYAFQPPYTSVENNPRMILSDRSGIGTELARQPISLSRAGSTGWLKMASPRESQQLAITLTVCLHQSTRVC